MTLLFWTFIEMIKYGLMPDIRLTLSGYECFFQNLSVRLYSSQLSAVTMAGPPGQSGQSAQSPAGQELSKGVDHVMQPVIPAPDRLSRPASAAWSNATAVVGFFFFSYPVSVFYSIAFSNLCCTVILS